MGTFNIPIQDLTGSPEFVLVFSRLSAAIASLDPEIIAPRLGVANVEIRHVAPGEESLDYLVDIAVVRPFLDDQPTLRAIPLKGEGATADIRRESAVFTVPRAVRLMNENRSRQWLDRESRKWVEREENAPLLANGECSQAEAARSVPARDFHVGGM